MSGNTAGDLHIRRVLAEQIGSIGCEERRAALAESVYRCSAGRISWLTRLVYRIAICVHGRQKTTTLFMRFLLHAQRVEKVDYIERIIREVNKDLRAGRLSAQQVACINHTVQEAISSSKLPKNS